jgi:hypothetical protein
MSDEEKPRYQPPFGFSVISPWDGIRIVGATFHGGRLMSGTVMTERKITQAELAEIFGPTMPLEAWQLIAEPVAGMSLDEVRAELRRMADATRAQQARPGPMIERVAEAISDGVFRELGSPSDWCPAPGAMGTVARAVLAAMREPTEAMAQIGGEKLPGVVDTMGEADEAAADVWTAMIDAALGRTTPPNSAS